MATKFKYEAKDKAGKVVRGSVSAGTQSEAVAELRRRNLTPLDVAKSQGLAAMFSKPVGRKRQVAKKASCKKGELEVFTRQLSTMLGAGIPMLEALEILADQAESPGFAFCLDKVVEDIRNGSDLSQALEQQGAQAGAGATADGVEDEEALQAGAVVRELADAVEDQVDDLLADGVVAAGVVVGGVLLARDQLLRVVQLAVGAGAHLVDHGRLEVDEHAARDVLARAGLREEGVEGVVAAADGLVRGHLAVGLDAVLEAVQLPARVAGLHAALTQVDGDDLTHD